MLLCLFLGLRRLLGFSCGCLLRLLLGFFGFLGFALGLFLGLLGFLGLFRGLSFLGLFRGLGFRLGLGLSF